MVIDNSTFAGLQPAITSVSFVEIELHRLGSLLTHLKLSQHTVHNTISVSYFAELHAKTSLKNIISY